MNANFVSELMAQNIDKEAMVQLLSEKLLFQQEEINALREQVQYLQTQVYGGTTK